MNNKITLALATTAAVAGIALLGWQSWNTHQLQQQVVQLQQQLQPQSGAVALTQNQSAAPPALAPALPLSPPQQQSAAPRNAPSATDPFWGDDDPFAEMERMQEQMHQHMQNLLSGMGVGKNGNSLFDMDPFQGGAGFGSSMGFGSEPDFAFKDKSDHYEIAVGIPEGSNVELNTSVHGRDLTIEGKVSSNQQNDGNGRSFRSVQTQQFARTLRLPIDADPLGIATRNDKGQVVVTVAKLPKGKGVSQALPAPAPGKVML